MPTDRANARPMTGSASSGNGAPRGVLTEMVRGARLLVARFNLSEGFEILSGVREAPTTAVNSVARAMKSTLPTTPPPSASQASVAASPHSAVTRVCEPTCHGRHGTPPQLHVCQGGSHRSPPWLPEAVQREPCPSPERSLAAEKTGPTDTGRRPPSSARCAGLSHMWRRHRPPP